MFRFPVLLVLAAALPLDASTVTYEFWGEADRVISGDFLEVGDTVGGSFTIDLSDGNKLSDFQMTAGPWTIIDGSGSGSARVTNDGENLDGTYDEIRIAARGSIAESEPINVIFILHDQFAERVTSDNRSDILTDIPFIEDWDRRVFSFQNVMIDWQTLERTQLIIDPPPPPEPPLFGDANGDGQVTAYDLNVIGLNWQLPGEWEDGDFTGDGFVDAADLNQLGLNWQTRPPQAPLSVPEPSTAALALIALAFIARRHRQSQPASQTSRD